MKDLLVLLAHLLTTIAKLLGRGGARAVVADTLLMKQQLLVINRSWRRAPNFSAFDRFLFGFWSLFLNLYRIQRAAVIIRPSMLLKFHDIPKKRKYRLLYSSDSKGKLGPKGPSRELIQAIVEFKRRLSAQERSLNRLEKRCCEGLKTVESRCGAVALGSVLSVAAPFVWRCPSN